MTMLSMTSLNRRLWIREAAIHLTALLLFALILLNRSPNLLRPLSMNVMFGFGFTIPLVFGVLLLSFHIQGWSGSLFRLVASLSLFSLALAGIWSAGYT